MLIYKIYMAQYATATIEADTIEEAEAEALRAYAIPHDSRVEFSTVEVEDYVEDRTGANQCQSS